MKSVKFFFAIAVLCMAGMTGTVEAQERRNEDWKQKFMSEKIAFLTSEMQITPEEAQVFWPVYNQIWKEKDEVMKKYSSLSANWKKLLTAENPARKSINSWRHIWLLNNNRGTSTLKWQKGSGKCFRSKKPHGFSLQRKNSGDSRSTVCTASRKIADQSHRTDGPQVEQSGKKIKITGEGKILLSIFSLILYCKQGFLC